MTIIQSLPTGDISNNFENDNDNYQCQPCDDNDTRRILAAAPHPLGVHDGLEEEAEKDVDVDVRTEEAVKPAVPKDPYTPTAQERAEHEPTHLPFRSWCRQCVEGRLENNPHPHELRIQSLQS